MKSSERKQIIEHYINAYNRFDVDGMLTNLHDDIVFENISNGQVDLSLQGKAAFRVQAEQAATYFSQRQQSITSWKMSEQQVGIEIDYEGTFAQDMPNGAKKGDILKLKGSSTFLFQEDLIIRIEDKS